MQNKVKICLLFAMHQFSSPSNDLVCCIFMVFRDSMPAENSVTDIFSYVEFVANFLHVCKNGDPENPDSPLSHCCSSSTDKVHSASMGHLDSCFSEPQLTLVAVPIFDQQVQ